VLGSAHFVATTRRRSPAENRRSAEPNVLRALVRDVWTQKRFRGARVRANPVPTGAKPAPLHERSIRQGDGTENGRSPFLGPAREQRTVRKMTFQAYLDTIRTRTGLGPSEFHGLALERLFAGSRSSWRPWFDRLAGQVRGFGSDASIAPGRTYVALNRGWRKFGIVQPAAGHLDVGINCPGVPPVGRFASSKGWNEMVTHRVRIRSQDDDDELVEWLRDAHDSATASQNQP
jgi:hypothetical protein